MSVVVCRLKHGLILEVPSSDAQPTVLRLYHGANDNVPAELFAAWLARNADLPIVKRRDVFLVSDSVSDRLAHDTADAA